MIDTADPGHPRDVRRHDEPRRARAPLLQQRDVRETKKLSRCANPISTRAGTGPTTATNLTRSFYEVGIIDTNRGSLCPRVDVASLEGKVLDLEEELDAVKSDLRDATDEVETLTSDLVAARAAWSEVASERTAAESRIEDLRSSIRELVS